MFDTNTSELCPQHTILFRGEFDIVANFVQIWCNLHLFEKIGIVF